ncbi:MAG: nucleotide sugar dehydrogenase [Saprospiraceae bacterium]|nr:nucleotide sugar dehydrogenase [Saprospiraceae bacterium]
MGPPPPSPPPPPPPPPLSDSPPPTEGFKVIGFDISADRVRMMQEGIDPSRELDSSAFEGRDITFTADENELDNAHFHIVAVPTPVDEHCVPDLRPVLGASRSVGRHLKNADYVIFESTVYPGCTEEDCVPILEELSKLTFGSDFKVGYSPERINPGDKEHTVEKILKIVSGSDPEATEEIAKVYGEVIKAGIYKASSIKVAEAAKVIENTQRDINIALMNELSMIFDKLKIDTQEVLAAAGTKWNFLKFTPGLVGGHCIGVDPYYLVHKAREIGMDPQIITSGRRINDGMPAFIAKRLVQTLIKKGKNPAQCKVLVMGITFKENVSDIRNSKVADLIREMMGYSMNVHIIDPQASPNEVAHEYGLSMIDSPLPPYDAIMVAVNHKEFMAYDAGYYEELMSNDPVLFDLKGVYSRDFSETITYWRL